MQVLTRKTGVLERLLLLDRLRAVYEEAAGRGQGAAIFGHLLDLLKVRPRISARDLARIPREGPVVTVSNHPFGLLEGPVLGSLLSGIRPDCKFLCNSLLAAMPEIGRHCILVDPFGGPRAIAANLRGLRESIAWLKGGGMLAVFPAGEVAHVDWKHRAITDPPWNENIARIIRLTGATVVPLYFDGANSALFQLLGLLHPHLRTAMLPYEFLNKEDAVVDVRIGGPIPENKLASFSDDRQLIEYLRERTYLLRGRKTPSQVHSTQRQEKITAPGNTAEMSAEIAALEGSSLLLEQGEFQVFLERSRQIPALMREIGRLREVTFRQNGEGTGKAIDLDTFDAHYLQLFVWNREKREIVGAYRLGAADDILSRYGKRGLYTHTVFAYRSAFLEQIGPALEMGRSFVRREYQKSYAPLLLLWKGIGRYVSQNPRYRVLFGPVSISNDYAPASRQLMLEFLKSYCHSPNLSKLVRPRSPLRLRPRATPIVRLTGGEREQDIDDLTALIADIEADGKGVPILLKQYLNLGGKVVGFNLDARFSNALDGLIVVDLTRTGTRLLERYMGKEGARRFESYHARREAS
ncbi:MAG TPA: GNAT family N-acyltransferase [Bryobacteraceae bacterium]|nr:GNAT family N-acyltransferase [Bryobacteraceae bacterium]